MHIRHEVTIALTVLLVALVGVTGWSLNAFRRYQPYSGFLDASTRNDRRYLVQLTDVDVRGRSQARPLWSVHTRQMTLLMDRTRVVADGVTRGVMLEKSRPKLNFVADRAVYSAGLIDPDKATLEVTGRIHITSVGAVEPLDSRVALDADHAYWFGDSATLQCPAPVSGRFARADWKQPVDVDARGLTWDNKARVLRFDRQATMYCPVPGDASPAAPRMCLSSASVTWERAQSLVRCNLPAHVVYPLAHSRRPMVIDAASARYDQNSGRVDCPSSTIADFEMPGSRSQVHVVAAQAVWMPKTGQLDAPAGAHADISSLGGIDCSGARIDTRAHQGDFNALRLVADSKDIAPIPPPAVDPDRVFVDAPEGGHWDEQTSILTLRGPVKFTQGDSVMNMVGAIYNRKANTADALSPVTITDPENTLTGDHATVNFKTKIAVVTGNVKIRQVPRDQADPRTSDKDSMDDASKQPTDLACDKLVYNYRDKTAVATGHIVIVQKHRTVTAESGTYDAHAKIAHLEGNVIGKTDDDRLLKAPRATISTKKGNQWIEFPNQVNFEFTPSDEDNPRVKNETPAAKEHGP